MIEPDSEEDELKRVLAESLRHDATHSSSSSSNVVNRHPFKLIDHNDNHQGGDDDLERAMRESMHFYKLEGIQV